MNNLELDQALGLLAQRFHDESGDNADTARIAVILRCLTDERFVEMSRAALDGALVEYYTGQKP